MQIKSHTSPNSLNLISACFLTRVFVIGVKPNNKPLTPNAWVAHFQKLK